MPEIFSDALRRGPDRKLYNYKVDDEWKSYTYQEVYDIIQHLGFGLRSLGLKEKDKVGILSENRPEWSMTDWACAHFNMVSVPVYHTSMKRQIGYIIKHAECRAVVASTREQVEKLLPLKKDLPDLEHIVMLDDAKDIDDNRIITFSDLLAKGKEEKARSGVTMKKIAGSINADDLWSIIYTSGTSGDPKGVLLSHFNIAANIQQTQAHANFKKNKRWLSFLPLSHSLERITSLFSFWIGGEIYYAESIAKVAENMKEVKPHYMTVVPRLLEKIYAAVLERIIDGPATKQKIFEWAQKIGHKTVNKYLIYNKRPIGVLGIKYTLAKHLVFDKIAEIFGGDFIRCVSGGAPLSREVGEFFAAAGVRIQEGYGLTEMSPITHANVNEYLKFGTVGIPLPDVETRIAQDGEILLRGPNRMQGYYKDPEGTAEAIDKDGWFYTGDIGFVDEDGYLKITDRKKNIIVTAGGKNIAPAAVEREITSSKYIEQAIVVGDRRKYLIAILVPSVEMFAKWGKLQDPPLEFNNYEEVATSKDVEKMIRRELDLHQKELAGYEQIKYFFIAPQPFSIESDDMTASMKIKRNKVLEKYKTQIEELYKN